MAGENTLKSPDQPILSLRCGQSVGILNTLASVDQVTFLKNLLSSSWLVL